MSKPWTPQPLKNGGVWNMRQQTVGSLTLTYNYFNYSPDKTTILFLYGFAGNIEYLREIGPILSDNDKYNVLVIDYPGHGYGDGSHDFNVPQFVEAVSKLLDILQEDKIILVGYSFGGAIAMQLHHIIKDKIEKLVLLNCDMRFAYSPYKYLFYKSYQNLLNLGINIAVNLVAINLLTDKYMSKQYRAESKDVVMFNSLPHVKSFYNQIIFNNYENLLSEINCPTLVIGSKCDFLISVKRTLRLQKLIPGSDIYIQPDIGHLCVVTNSIKTGQVILDWLETVSRRQCNPKTDDNAKSG